MANNPTPSAPTTLFDYYKSNNQALPSVQDRAKLFESSGLGSAKLYTGRTDQNALLLGHLIGSSKTTAPAVDDSTTSAGVSSSTPTPPPTPGNPTATNAPTTGESYKAAIEPAGGEPAAPKYADQYAQLRADQGIDTLSDNINHLQASKNDWQDQLITFKAKENIGATSAGVYNARVSEEERNIQEHVD